MIKEKVFKGRLPIHVTTSIVVYTVFIGMTKLLVLLKGVRERNDIVMTDFFLVNMGLLKVKVDIPKDLCRHTLNYVVIKKSIKIEVIVDIMIFTLDFTVFLTDLFSQNLNYINDRDISII